MMRSPMQNVKLIPKCLIYIDKEGNWYHKGAPMIHKPFILDFFRNMFMDEHGRCVIQWDGKLCEVDVEDTPIVVRSVESWSGGEHRKVILVLSDETREELDLDSLWIGPENVLYAKVRQGAMPARFLRPAYYRLMELLECDESSGTYFIELDGRIKTLLPAS